MAAYMRKTGILPVCTNNEARAYFAGKGLTYADVTEGDILALVMLLNKHIKKANADCETSMGFHVPELPNRPQTEDQRHPDQLLPLRQQPLLRAPGVHQFQRRRLDRLRRLG